MPTERGRDIPLDRSNLGRNADRMMTGMMKLFHPRAAQVLAPHLSRDLRTQAELEREVSPEEKAVFDNVRNWLIARMEQLELGALDNGQLILNPWNESHSLGLQSVSVGVNRLVEGPKRVPALLPGEWRHPTIGVIAKGMLERSFPRVAGVWTGFDVDNGKAEELTGMSKEFVVGNDAYVTTLKAGKKMTVAAPDRVEVCIERPVDPGMVVGMTVFEAVYACAFKENQG